MDPRCPICVRRAVLNEPIAPNSSTPLHPYVLPPSDLQRCQPRVQLPHRGGRGLPRVAAQAAHSRRTPSRVLHVLPGYVPGLRASKTTTSNDEALVGALRRWGLRVCTTLPSRTCGPPCNSHPDIPMEACTPSALGRCGAVVPLEPHPTCSVSLMWRWWAD